MVAALIAVPQASVGAAPNEGTWSGFNAGVGLTNSAELLAVSAADPAGWGVASTDDLGGAGTDVWINNHAVASEWYLDGAIGAAAADARDENPATPTALEADDSHGIAFTDLNGDGTEDLIEIRARDNANSVTDGTTLGVANGSPSMDAVGAEDDRGRGRAVLPVDMDWDGTMDIVVGNLDRTALGCDDDSDPDPDADCFDSTGDAAALSEVYLGDGDFTFTATDDNANNDAINDADITLLSMTRTGPGAPSVIVTHNNFTVGLDSLATNVSVPTAAGANGIGQVQGAGNNANNIRDIAFGDLDGDINTVEYAVARIDGEDNNDGAGGGPDGTPDNLGDRAIVMGDTSQVGTPLTEISNDLRADSCGTIAFGDFDNDRDIDIFGGCTFDTQDNDIMLENDGSGNFAVIPLGATTTARAVASSVSDLNGDGFLDIVVTKGFDTNAGEDFSYTNGGGTNNYLQIDLDSTDNPDAMGAQVFVGSKGFADTADAGDWQVREVAHSFHRGQDTRMLHFGLGQAEEIAPVVVVWPEGAVEACTLDGALNSRVTITQGGANCATVADLAATLAAAPAYAPLVDERPLCFGEPITIALDEEIANLYNEEPFVVDFATTGTNGNDVILGTDAGETINGLGGNDLICAEGGADIVNGGTGNDEVAGGDGDDFINGGDGVDRLFGQDGNDTLNGEDGRDKLAGGGGNDELNGGADRDRLDGNRGRDTLNGGTGRDPLFGSSGDDIINGDEGNDRIRGGSGNDTISGNGGNDFIDGTNGDDTIFGNGGDDTIIGGDDTDDVNGGTGTDSCTESETTKNCEA